ncbi:wax ester/triacylglycerol synthase domain-containing protein [Cystobacter fuscus]
MRGPVPGRGCEKALDALAGCAARSGCGPDDSDCVEKACGKQCDRTFEPAPRSPEKETPDPCADGSVGSGAVPKGMVGTWSLEVASVRPEEKAKVVGQDEPQDVKPRPDFERTLEVTSNGCFLLRTKLEDATLGRGSELEVRSWGAFVVDEKEDTVELRTKSGQAVGTVCGKPRVVGLSKGKFQGPSTSTSWRATCSESPRRRPPSRHSSSAGRRKRRRNKRMAERMSPVDAAWLQMEEPTSLMVITAVLWFDGPLDFERLARRVEERLVARHPRVSQRVVTRGLWSTPHWEEVPGFRLEEHLRRTRLPPPEAGTCWRGSWASPGHALSPRGPCGSCISSRGTRRDARCGERAPQHRGCDFPGAGCCSP